MCHLQCELWPTVTTKKSSALANLDLDDEQVAEALKALKKGKIVVAATGNDRDDSAVAGKRPSGLALFHSSARRQRQLRASMTPQ